MSNSLDARAFGQPGGVFDSLTNGLNRAVDSWSRAKDNQSQRDFNQQELAAKLGNDRVDRAMRFAQDAGTFDPTGLTPEQSTAIEKVATVQRQDRARKVQDRQTADQRTAAFLAEAGYDPSDMGMDLLPGSEQFRERAHQMADEHAARMAEADQERTAHGVLGEAKAFGLLRHSLGMDPTKADPYHRDQSKDAARDLLRNQNADPADRTWAREQLGIPAPVVPPEAPSMWSRLTSMFSDSPSAASLAGVSAPAIVPAAPQAPSVPRGIVRRAGLQAAVDAGHYRTLDEAAADAQAQGYGLVP